MLEPTNEELSEREKEILRLVATGASNKEIALRLAISPNTVKVHVRNIFVKIGVASRTEATLHAIQHGYIQMPGPGQETPAPAPTFIASAAEAAPSSPAPLAPARGRWPRYLLGGLALAMLAAGLAWFQPWRAPTPQPTPLPAVERWDARAALTVARSDLAVAVYDNALYAIGGTTSAGVTGAVERYDPQANTWTALPAQPQPVTDVNAAVVGQQIYVPGGRRADGTLSDALAVYDTRLQTWQERARLPHPVSAYALAAFEGKLYLFGGWDGQQYVATVYVYDPEQDRWTTSSPMPTARGLAGAAVAGNYIYVVGGTAGGPPLTTNEEFSPSAGALGQPAWRARAPLPQARQAPGVASVADLIHVVGGHGPSPSAAFTFFAPRNEWLSFEGAVATEWIGPRAVALETDLYVVGGRQANQVSAQTWSYRAIYTILLPVVH